MNFDRKLHCWKRAEAAGMLADESYSFPEDYIAGGPSGSRPDAEAPGTPIKSENDHFGTVDAELGPQHRFELNSQTISGLVFFFALDTYKNKVSHTH